MTYQAQVMLRQGEIVPVYGEVSTPAPDTLTVQLAPASPYTAPRFSLYDGSGTLVSGFPQTIPNGNFTAGAAQSLLFWYVLDTTPLPVGAYVARLSIAVKSTTDQIVRQRMSEVQLSILPVVEITATYDLNAPLGQVRLYCLEADVGNAVFTDAELGQFLSDCGNIPLLAAAMALEVLAVDNLRLSNAIRIGAYKNTSASIYQALVERAKRLRELAIVPCVVVPTTAVFTISPDGGYTSGTIDLW